MRYRVVNVARVETSVALLTSHAASKASKTLTVMLRLTRYSGNTIDCLGANIATR